MAAGSVWSHVVAAALCGAVGFIVGDWKDGNLSLWRSENSRKIEVTAAEKMVPAERRVNAAETQGQKNRSTVRAQVSDSSLADCAVDDDTAELLFVLAQATQQGSASGGATRIEVPGQSGGAVPGGSPTAGQAVERKQAGSPGG